MKIFITLLLCILGMSTLMAQSDNANYNKTLADSLGADDYGMKGYVLVMLKTGSNTTTDKKTQDSLFRGHLANIGRLAKEGKMIVAGPLFENDKKYEGIFILNVKTIAEATTLLNTDPAIKAKLLDPELFQWYGSAALPMYLKYHDKVQKKSF